VFWHLLLPSGYNYDCDYFKSSERAAAATFQFDKAAIDAFA
jgi:hypothetical protein